MESGDGTVIIEPVVPANHAEAHNMLLVVEDIEALGAGSSRQTGDDVDFAEGADVAVADDDVAALEEVLVGLGAVEAADDGPDGGDGGGDGLDDGGAALVGADGVGVVVQDFFGYVIGERDCPCCGMGLLFFVGVDGCGCDGHGVGVVNSVEVKR